MSVLHLTVLVPLIIPLYRGPPCCRPAEDRKVIVCTVGASPHQCTASPRGKTAQTDLKASKPSIKMISHENSFPVHSSLCGENALPVYKWVSARKTNSSALAMGLHLCCTNPPIKTTVCLDDHYEDTVHRALTSKLRYRTYTQNRELPLWHDANFVSILQQ